MPTKKLSRRKLRRLELDESPKERADRVAATKANSKQKAGKTRSSNRSRGKAAPGRKVVRRNHMKTRRAKEFAALYEARRQAVADLVSKLRAGRGLTAKRNFLAGWLTARLDFPGVDDSNWLDVVAGEVEAVVRELRRQGLYPEEET